MSIYNQPTAKLSDREMLHALLKNIPGSVHLDQDRLDKNIILPKAAGLAGRQRLTIERSIDFKSPRTDSIRAGKSTPVGLDDATVHYLSPASVSPLSARTVNEGDFYGLQYETPSYMRFIPGFEVPEGSYASSTISCVEPELQRTLAIIKPEAVEYEDTILRAIVDAGFSIISKRVIHFTPEQVSELYCQYYGSPAFPYMVVNMSIGPIVSLCLAAVNAVEKWKNLVGPERALRAEWFYPMSMRVRFGLHEDMPGTLHASENLPEASKENRYVNPESILEPIVCEESKVTDYCNMCVNPTLLRGLAEVIRAKPVDPIIHLADWLLLNNPYQPRFPPDVAVLPT